MLEWNARNVYGVSPLSTVLNKGRYISSLTSSLETQNGDDVNEQERRKKIPLQYQLTT